MKQLLQVLTISSLFLISCSNSMQANRVDQNSESTNLAKTALQRQNALLMSLEQEAPTEEAPGEETPAEEEVPATPDCLADVEPEMEASFNCAGDLDALGEDTEIKFDEVIGQFQKCLEENSVQIQTLLTQILDKTNECLGGQLSELEERIGGQENTTQFDFKNIFNQLQN